MRLLRVATLKFEDFHDEDERPRYVVLSHRWIGSEITFQDVKKGRNKDVAGYKKIEDFARYISKELPSIEWLWIDTCCIDKRSPDELSYSLNQMFYWYRNAELCIAHLKDVDAAEDQTAFEQSDWFRRGWTLQELLAPRLVVFVTKDWHVIGVKGKDDGTGSLMAGPNLTEAIARITEIPEEVLNNYETSHHFTTDDKLQWMDGRRTQHDEDMSYALLGIMGVTMPAVYGEGFDTAKRRLLAEVELRKRVVPAVGPGDSPLYAASHKGYDDEVHKLIKKGADVNAVGGKFGTALRAASFEGHRRVVQILIDSGADVNAHQGPDGRDFGYALQAACFGRSIYSGGGHKRVVEMLLAAGANVNAQGGLYGTALQAAASSSDGNVEIVKLLLEAGADVNAQGGRFGNALQAAKKTRRAIIERILLEKGATDTAPV